MTHPKKGTEHTLNANKRGLGLARDCNLIVRVTVAEKEAIKTYCKEQQKTMSDLFREMLKKGGLIE